MTIVVGQRLFAESLATLRHCGEGRRECVLVWLADRRDPGQVVEVVHPDHVGSPHGYELNQSWLSKLWDELAATGQRILAQVHSHPGEAFHSAIDDRFPIIPRPGLLSLVVPRFAEGAVTLDGTYLARLEADGSWSELDPRIELRL